MTKCNEPINAIIAHKSLGINAGETFATAFWGFVYHTLQNIIKRYNQDRPKEQSLPLIPFHGLRHTAASLLIASNQDIKTVSARMGHSQVSTTLDIYTHRLEAGDKKASDALEIMLKKKA